MNTNQMKSEIETSKPFEESSKDNEVGFGIHEKVYVPGGVDYDKLVERFGCKLIDDSLRKRVEELTKKPLHPFLKRAIIYSHKDLDVILDEYASGKPFYLYTGIGPSSKSFHMGHLLPFLVTKYLQEAFDVPVVIQLTDDEKYLHKDMSLEEIHENLIENCKDIIACGYDPKKTFIFSNFDYVGHMYQNIVKIEKLVTNNQIFGIFGVNGSDNIGKTSFPAIQAAPSFHSSFPEVFKKDKFVRRCLIPCGIDQDPYFRMTRDVAPRLGPSYMKPALMHSKFLPALQGLEAKMSSSDPTSAIFLTDTEEVIRDKIIQYAFSGGRVTKKEHRQFGANVDVDICMHYLHYLMEDDDELETIRRKYKSGEMLTSEVKKRTVEVIAPIVKRHQEARAKITDEVVRQFMTCRALDL